MEPNILIIVQGGVVQDVRCSAENYNYRVVDLDDPEYDYTLPVAFAEEFDNDEAVLELIAGYGITLVGDDE